MYNIHMHETAFCSAGLLMGISGRPCITTQLQLGMYLYNVD